MSFPSLDLWQYRISSDLQEGIELLPGLRLQTGPGLPVTKVTDAAGLHAGYILGFSIDLNARQTIGASWQAPVKLGIDATEFTERVLDSIGGRFVWIYQSETECHLHPDCSAQVPVVFDAAAKVAGSTAHALFDEDDYADRFDRASFEALRVDGEGWFPAGLTAHRGLHRLLAHHYLDLSTWQSKRFWPRSEISETQDTDDAVDEFISIVQAQIEALVNGPKRLAIAVTAGLDTRSVLACSREFVKEADCLTVVGSDRHATDSLLAKRITGKFGLNHITLPRTEATPEERELFIRRGGHCNGDTNSRFHPSVWPIAETHVMVGGLGAEQARAFFWRNDDTPDTKLTADILIKRMGLPPLENCRKAVARLLDEMPVTSALQKLDLFYAEDRHSSWYAAQFCCDPTLVRQAPMLTTRTGRLMAQLPPDWKRTSRLGHEVIRRTWPELGALPYNSLGYWNDLAIKVQRAIANPQLITKKLRKMGA
ncbi:MAG: hypothetical protein Tsb0019_03780 [Roseibium sp.]